MVTILIVVWMTLTRKRLNARRFRLRKCTISRSCFVLLCVVSSARWSAFITGTHRCWEVLLSASWIKWTVCGTIKWESIRGVDLSSRRIWRQIANTSCANGMQRIRRFALAEWRQELGYIKKEEDKKGGKEGAKKEKIGKERIYGTDEQKK